MKRVELYVKVRRAVLADGMSRRAAARYFGIDRKTVDKMLVFPVPLEHGSTLITSNLPFDEWTSVFGSERLTGALLDRLTRHVNILELNGDSFRLATSRKRQKRPTPDNGGAA